MQDIQETLDDISSLYHNYIKVYNPKIEFYCFEDPYYIFRNSQIVPDMPSHGYFNEIVQSLKEHQHKYQGWNRFVYLDIKNSFHIKFTIVQGKLRDQLVLTFSKTVDHRF